MIPSINVQVLQLIWTMTQTTAELNRSVALANEHFAGVCKTINTQATANNAGTRSVSALQSRPAPSSQGHPSLAQARS